MSTARSYSSAGHQVNRGRCCAASSCSTHGLGCCAPSSLLPGTIGMQRWVLGAVGPLSLPFSAYEPLSQHVCQAWGYLVRWVLTSVGASCGFAGEDASVVELTVTHSFRAHFGDLGSSNSTLLQQPAHTSPSGAPNGSPSELQPQNRQRPRLVGVGGRAGPAGLPHIEEVVECSSSSLSSAGSLSRLTIAPTVESPPDDGSGTDTPPRAGGGGGGHSSRGRRRGGSAGGSQLRPRHHRSSPRCAGPSGSRASSSSSSDASTSPSETSSDSGGGTGSSNSSPPGSGDKSNRGLAPVLGLPPAALGGDEGMLAPAAAPSHHGRHPHHHHRHLHQGEGASSSHHPLQRRSPCSVWEVDPREVLVGKRLAVGGFSEVFLGRFQASLAGGVRGWGQGWRKIRSSH